MSVHKRLFLLIAIGALRCPCVEAAATDIYVAQNVAGSGDGSSCANAKAGSFFNTLGNWGSGSSQIGPGTTVHLCGTFTGAAGATGLTAQGSGTSGHPITLLFEPGAKMTSPVWGTALDISHHDFIIVDGGTPCGAIAGGQLSPNGCNGTIQNTANGTALANHMASTFIFAQACNNCEVRNMALINNYVHAQCEAASGCDTAAGTTENQVLNFWGSNWQIHDNLVHDASWAINEQAQAGDLNIEIYRNNIYNVAHGLAVYGGNTWSGPVKVHDNRIHDFQNWDTGGTDAYHADGMHFFGMNLKEAYIYNNFFTTQNQCCITGDIFLEGGAGSTWTDAGNGTYYVFNNVMLEPSGSVNGLSQTWHGTNSVLFNNTIVGASSTDNTGVGATSSNLKFNNNILSSFSIFMSFDSADMPTTFANVATDLDYQAYANCTGFNCFFTRGVDSGSFTTWKAGCGGCDTHSSYSAALNLNADGSPSVSSTAIIGKGKNLSTLCTGNLTPLCTDITGKPRPTSGAWDLGAYQFSTGTTTSPCDVNKDNTTNIVDVQQCVNQSLGVATCTADINKDGICNVVDVQRVVNAALGGQCVSP